MNVKNWNFSYNKEKKKEWKQNILDTISLWGAIGLLWFSFISIIGEHFPEFIQVAVLVSKSDKISTSYVDATNFEIIGMDWWIISLFVIVLWLGYDWPKDYLKKLVIPCRLAGIAIPVVYVVMNFQKIIDGFGHLAAIYLPFVNSYYKTRFYFGAVGEKEYSVVAFTAIAMLLWWMVWLLAYGWKKRILLIVFPILALVLELSVGLSPLGNGLLYMFFGAVLLAIMGGTSVLKKAMVLVCVWVSVILSGAWFTEDIQSLTTKEAKQELLRWQNNLSLDSLNPLKWLQIDLHFNWEPLNNNTPQYTGKTVLEVETDQEPLGTVYLKGFYGTNYENGNWSYDDSAFKAACREARKDSAEVAEQIFQMPYQRMGAYVGLEEHYPPAYALEKISAYTISYVGTMGDVAYAPYVSDYTSLDQHYTFLGDYLLKKSLWDKKIQVRGLNTHGSLYEWISVNDCIAVGTFGYNLYPGLGLYYNPINLTEQLNELTWINALADAYLQIPKDAEFVLKAGAKMESYLLMYENKVAGIDMESENYTRIVYATAVKDYLAQQMSYSLKLDNLPMGRDPIDYALNESHEGYCMHFASAATLLLRELGVPARYVSGYAVSPSAFVYDEETELYKAEVGDFMAHAWVEIYLDNIGWVPADPTPGSSLDSLPTDEDIQRWESTSNAHRQDIIDQEEESESEESEQPSEDTQIETEDSQTEDTEQDSQTESESEEEEKNPQGVGPNAEKFDVLSLLKGVGIIGGLVVVVFLLFMTIRYTISRYEGVLMRDYEKNMTRRVVKRINRRLYNTVRLVMIGSWLRKKWTDAEYRDALAKQFIDVSEEEWDRYMDIVKKNHYSHEMISIEEMHYCHECYKKAKLFNISLTKLWDNKK